MKKCPFGKFFCFKTSYSNSSTITEDKYHCKSCPNGYYAPLIANYTYFLSHLEDFSNHCDSENSYQCNYIKGWKFLEDKIITVINKIN